MSRELPKQKLVTVPEIQCVRRSPPADPKLIYPFGRFSEQEYLATLVSKRVIIVGPAGYLQGKNLGKWIDSFDIVVRINHAIPILLPEDYGSRTDVLYHILSHRGVDDANKKLVTRDEVEEWQKNGLKWLVSSHGPISERVKKMGPIIDSAFPWACVHHVFATRIKQQIGQKSPNTGITAIMHLLSSKLRSLHVVGFDFYRSGVYSGYGDVKQGEDAKAVNDRWHNIDAQLSFMKRIALRDNRLIIDDVLKAVLNDDQPSSNQ